MKIGMFGYPGDGLGRVQTVVQGLKAAGAEKIVCLGGFVGSDKSDGDSQGPAAVLRWLRSSGVTMLANDMDREFAGWRIQSVSNVSGYIQPRVRRFLSTVTREEGHWIHNLPAAYPVGKVLCCAEALSSDATYPVPLTHYNATELFASMKEKAAFFPAMRGPSFLVRQEPGGEIEAEKYGGIEECLDSSKIAAIIGAVTGGSPLNDDVSWSAVVDDEATQLSLICLDAKTLKPVPEKAAMLLQRAEVNWK